MNIKQILSWQLVIVNLIFAVCLFTSVAAQSTKQFYLLALSKGDHTLAIVNSSTLKVIAKIPVGPDPHEVVASTDGKIAYVTNTGGGKSYEINVIDLVGQKALPNIDTRPLFGPHGITFVGGKFGSLLKVRSRWVVLIQVPTN
jgi:YVTN family beta-propeller protein